MKFMSVSFSLAIFLGLALVVPSTLSAQQSDPGTEGGTQEVVVGSFGCSGPIRDRPPEDPVYGDVGVEIRGTTGIVQFLEFSSDLVPNSPFEICEAIITDFAAGAQSLGCTTGRVTIRPPDRFSDRISAFFGFVCDGRRNQVMNAIAGLTKQIFNVDEVVP
jgi:hypothetical protein